MGEAEQSANWSRRCRESIFDRLTNKNDALLLLVHAEHTALDLLQDDAGRDGAKGGCHAEQAEACGAGGHGRRQLCRQNERARCCRQFRFSVESRARRGPYGLPACSIGLEVGPAGRAFPAAWRRQKRTTYPADSPSSHLGRTERAATTSCALWHPCTPNPAGEALLLRGRGRRASECRWLCRRLFIVVDCVVCQRQLAAWPSHVRPNVAGGDGSGPGTSVKAPSSRDVSGARKRRPGSRHRPGVQNSELARPADSWAATPTAPSPRPGTIVHCCRLCQAGFRRLRRALLASLEVLLRVTRRLQSLLRPTDRLVGSHSLSI